MTGAGWREVQLGEICEFKYGKSLPAAEREPGPAPVYGSNGPVGTHNRFLAHGPTIVIGRKGSFGEVSYSTEGCWPIDTTYYVDSSATSVDLRWLYYRLGDLGLKELNRAAAVPGLNRDDAYAKRLLLPPPEEQRRIAEVLDQVSKMRARRQQSTSLLDELARSVFLDMFGDPLSNPAGWKMRAISDLGTVVTGNTPPRKDIANYGDDIEWIKSDNINPAKMHVTKASEGLSSKGIKLARVTGPESILVTCIAGSPNSIGNSALTGRRVAFNQQINAFSPKEVDLLYALMHLRTGKRLIQGKSTGGMKGLVSKSSFSSIQLMVPPLSLQREFAHKLLLLERHRIAQEDHRVKVDELFASLQAKAFRGEL
ncbi:hypothetical protein DP939_32035 [Spongiactinospora rosea]|uniref:Type I restriction modification DNA specificity domain-containing protein n=1 Tax=Spongiactinospora rosea TaxID=2248750 RepID=A0A366LSQ5_9ACTN|nr:restriction endonuclease subunit S [Spongiactinospora rosea]RBQ16232.1 hypothetical protein DP939_32035 [Spongiactinospora rosea]